MDLPEPNLKKVFLSHLKEIFGSHGYSLKATDRLAYMRDENMKSRLRAHYKQPEPLPDVIVWPHSVAQVQKIIRLCQQAKVPLIPVGGGSGVCGGANPVQGGVVLDLKRLKKIIKLDEVNHLVTVEAGLLIQHLEDQLVSHGFTLGHFPNAMPSSSIGGGLAVRQSGFASTRYGALADHVVDLEVVTGTGQLLQTESVLHAKGINLNEVFLGSEGSLGVMTKATLKIWRLPKKRSFSAFQFSEMATAVAAMQRIAQAGILPAVVRLYDPIDTLVHLSSAELRSKWPLPDFLHKLQKMMRSGFFRSSLLVPKIMHMLGEKMPIGCTLLLVHEGLPVLVSAEQKLADALCVEMGATRLDEAMTQNWYQHGLAEPFQATQWLLSGVFKETISASTTWDHAFELYEKMIQSLSTHVLVMGRISCANANGATISWSVMGALLGHNLTEALYERVWAKAVKVCQESGAVLHRLPLLLQLGVPKQAKHRESLALFQALKKFYDPAGILNPGKMASKNLLKAA